MSKINYFLFLSLLIFQGCSSKQYFEPEDLKYTTIEEKWIGSTIIDYNNDGATLYNNKFIDENGISEMVLNDNFIFINNIKKTIISADNNGTLIINDNKKMTTIKFDKSVISANIKDNLLAFITNDNSINLYDLESKKIIFKEYLKISLINDIKIANPVFLDSIVLYPTLDGKIVIVNKNKKTIVKTINLDPKAKINNIIFLQTIGDSLIAATTKKLFSFVDGQAKIIDTDIKSIIIHDKYIYVATLDGKIIKYNQKLTELKSKKFKFAKFHTLGYSQNLYALESQGYIIKFDDNFEKIETLNFYFDEEEKVISFHDKLYFQNRYITIK